MILCAKALVKTISAQPCLAINLGHFNLVVFNKSNISGHKYLKALFVLA